MISNQSAIGRGLVLRGTVEDINRSVVSEIEEHGGRIFSPGSFAIFSEFVGFGATFVFMAGSAAVAAITIGRFVKGTLRRL